MPSETDSQPLKAPRSQDMPLAEKPIRSRDYKSPQPVDAPAAANSPAPAARQRLWKSPSSS